MLTKVYHCSLSHITEFDFSKGVHFGGLYSALEAALRHVYPHRRNIETIYIHECLLEIPDNVLEEDDLGSNENWQTYALRNMRNNGIDVLQYTNRYEVDIHPSYYVLDGSYITLKNVKKLRPYEAEEQINEFLYAND